MRAQICFEEALKLRKKELEEAESKQRGKRDRRELPKELQEVPEEVESEVLISREASKNQ